MLCFILDRPYRGRYFHDCTTPETFASLHFLSLLCHRRPPRRVQPRSPKRGEAVSKIGPRLTERREPKVIDFHQIRRSFTMATIPNQTQGHTPSQSPATDFQTAAALHLAHPRPRLRSPLHPPRHLPLRRDRLGAPRRRHPGLQGQDHLRAEERRGPRRLVHDRHQHRGLEISPRPQRHQRARIRCPRSYHSRRRIHPRLGHPGRLLRHARRTPRPSTPSSPTFS